MPELHPLLAGRWSPRGFDGLHEVGHAELASLLEAARWAPSAGNGQPWRFAIGRRDDETHKRIFECLAGEDQRWAWRASALVAAAFVTSPPADGPAPVVPSSRRPADGATTAAPADGVTTAAPTDSATTAAPTDGATTAASGGGSRAVDAAYDLGQAVAHLGAQASALHLHTHQMLGFDAARLHRELELPDTVTVHAVVAVGRVGDPAVLPHDLQALEFRLRERRPIEQLLLA